jgi:hypothetical protein
MSGNLNIQKLRPVRHFLIIALIMSCCDRDKNTARQNGDKKPMTATFAERAAVRHKPPAGVSVKAEKNGLIVPRSWQFVSERLDHPGLAELRVREKLDRVIAPGKDEFEKMRLLCDWVNSQWKNGRPDPYPPWDANLILKMIRAGETGGFCAQYAVVFCQACLSLGWQARYVELNPKEGPNSHFITEVWSNQYNKWIVLDPFYDCHFELAENPLPLSALEVREALIKGGDDAVRIVRGKGAHAYDNMDAGEPQILVPFYSVSADMRNDHLSRPLHFWDRHDTYLTFKDSHTRDRDTVFLHYTSDPFDFNFPMNQVQIRLVKSPSTGTLTCQIRTNMARVKALEIRHDKGDWNSHPSPFEKSRAGSALQYTLTIRHGSVITYQWKLKPGDNSISIRAVNRLGVVGPASFLWVSYREKVD